MTNMLVNKIRGIKTNDPSVSQHNTLTEATPYSRHDGYDGAKVRIISESPKPFVKNWHCSKLFIGFLISVWEEMCTFADGSCLGKRAKLERLDVCYTDAYKHFATLKRQAHASSCKSMNVSFEEVK